MNTRNNHQNQSANRATRRHGAKAKAAKPTPSALFSAMFELHVESLDLVEQLNLANAGLPGGDATFTDFDLDTFEDF